MRFTIAALLVSTALWAPTPPWWVFDSAQKLEAKLPPRDARGYVVVCVSLASAQVNTLPRMWNGTSAGWKCSVAKVASQGR